VSTAVVGSASETLKL